MSKLKGLSDHPREVEEIMGAVPLWIQRWSFIALALALAVIIGVCAYIRIPEKVPIEVSPAATTNVMSKNGSIAHSPRQIYIGHARVARDVWTRLYNGVRLESAAGAGEIVRIADCADVDGMYDVEIALNTPLHSHAVFQATVSESSVLQHIFSRRIDLNVQQ